MKTTIRTLTITAAALGMFAVGSLSMLGGGTAHADDEPKITFNGPLTLVTATPTPKIRIVKPLGPLATPTKGIQLVTPTATPTPKLEIQLPPTKTPTPKPEIAAPPTRTPTPKPEIAAPATATPTDEPTEEPATPEQPTEAPAAPNTPEPPAQQPQGEGSNDGNGAGSEAESQGDAQDEAPDTEAAETSDQYSLEDERRTGRERGNTIENVPGVNLVVPVAKEVIGADELSFVGGALALFGLSLGLVAYKRERRTEDDE